MKKRARKATARAIKRGTLIPLPCEVCGVPDVEAHHDDYAKRFDVRWLCVTHHREHHRNERNRLSCVRQETLAKAPQVGQMTLMPGRFVESL